MTRVIVAISVALIVVGGVVGVALASNWANFTAGSNATVTFSQFSLTTTVHDAFHWSDVNNIEPTDIGTALYHGASSKEVEIYDGFYGSGEPPGLYTCTDWDGINLICNQGEVKINLTVIGDPPTVGVARWLQCHEVGHAVGLSHSTDTDSCIHGTEYESSTTLETHDTDLIDDNY